MTYYVLVFHDKGNLAMFDKPMIWDNRAGAIEYAEVQLTYDSGLDYNIHECVLFSSPKEVAND